jgi:hypothetical protein
MSPLDGLRQRLSNVGDDRRQVEMLRRLLAGSEEPKILRALAIVVSEVAEVVDDRFLVPLADLKDRVAEKCERVGAALPLSPAPQRLKCALRNLRTTVSPQVQMIISPWITDEFGNLSREVYADPAGPTWRP